MSLCVRVCLTETLVLSEHPKAGYYWENLGVKTPVGCGGATAGTGQFML